MYSSTFDWHLKYCVTNIELGEEQNKQIVSAMSLYIVTTTTTTYLSNVSYTSTHSTHE